MGRQIRRVPLDFAWPLDVPYRGFIRPDDIMPMECGACEGMGWSPEAKEMHDRWWGKIPFRPEQTGSEPFTIETPGIIDYSRRKLLDTRAFYDEMHGATGDETIRREAARLCDLWNAVWQHHLGKEDVDAILASGDPLAGLTHRYCTQTRQWIRLDREPPTVREVNIWSLGLQGGLVGPPEYVVQQAEAARRGVSMSCDRCDGDGHVFRDVDQRRAFEEWAPVEPQTGEGWQMWETVSEGSPISPVCICAESLATHMAHEDRTRDDGMGYEGWLAFINGPGWAPTGTIVGSDVQSGVSAVGA